MITLDEHLENMDKFVRDMMKNKKTANEVLDMPINFIIEIMKDNHKPKKTNSFFDLLG